MAWYREEDGVIISDEQFREDCCNCTGFCADGNISVPCNGEKADCPHYHKLDTSDYDKEIRAKAIEEFTEAVKKAYASMQSISEVERATANTIVMGIEAELKGE